MLVRFSLFSSNNSGRVEIKKTDLDCGREKSKSSAQSIASSVKEFFSFDNDKICDATLVMLGCFSLVGAYRSPSYLIKTACLSLCVLSLDLGFYASRARAEIDELRFQDLMNNQAHTYKSMESFKSKIEQSLVRLEARESKESGKYKKMREIYSDFLKNN